MIKAILFDSDDTLIRYSTIGTRCVQQSAKILKLRIPRKDEIDSIYGRSFRYVVNKLWGDRYYKNVYNIYKKLVLKYKLKEVSGAKKTVNWAYKHYKIGVVSAKIRDIMIKNFKDAGFNTKKFKIMLSAEDTRYHKPDPRVFSKAIKKLKVKRNQILYVGDTISDFMAAKRAGFSFVGVTTGYFKNKDFTRVGLKKQNILKSIRYLPFWIKKNGSK